MARRNSTSRAVEPKAHGGERISDAEADQIVKSYEGRKALMTKRRMYSYERSVRYSNESDNFGFDRRAALGILTMPCKKLMRDIQKDRDTAVVLAGLEDGIAEYSKALEELSGLVQEAQRRLMIALCRRPDMAEIIEEAKRQRAGRTLATVQQQEVSHG